jgi:hypothetical protein
MLYSAPFGQVIVLISTPIESTGIANVKVGINNTIQAII